MEAGLNETDCGKAAIVATELANNISRYSPGGEVLLRSLGQSSANGIEILAIDRGPGMLDTSQCLTDGYSTGGTPGQGLGAVQRMSSEFDLFSSQTTGTVVFSRIFDTVHTNRPTKTFMWGAINRPAPLEQLSGDTWRIAERPSELVLMIADGLGHGPLAAHAADTAAAAFDENPFLPQIEYFAVADRRMRGTRGAAIAVAHINATSGSLKYAGIGNIAGNLRSRKEFERKRADLTQWNRRGRNAKGEIAGLRLSRASVISDALRRSAKPLDVGCLSGTGASAPGRNRGHFCTGTIVVVATT